MIPAQRQYGGRDVSGLTAKNRQRTLAAAARDAEAAKVVLAAGGLSARYRRVLQARVAHPEASMAELGNMVGMTKDVASGILRQALSKPGSGAYPRRRLVAR